MMTGIQLWYEHALSLFSEASKPLFPTSHPTAARPASEQGTVALVAAEMHAHRRFDVQELENAIDSAM